MSRKVMLNHTLLLWTLLITNVIGESVYADEYPFGRAFTTEEEREYLDRNRQLLLDKYKGSPKEFSESTLRLEDKTDRFVLSGLVVRDDGKNMVWVNGKSELSNNAHKYVENTHLIKRDLDSQKVRLIYEDKYRTLKPGQVWLVDKGLVKELHEIEEDRKERIETPSATDQSDPASQITDTIEQLQELQTLTQ